MTHSPAAGRKNAGKESEIMQKNKKENEAKRGQENKQNTDGKTSLEEPETDNQQANHQTNTGRKAISVFL